MQQHHLKTWPAEFSAVISGQKKFELRRNDRDFQVGDVLVLKEFVPCGTCNGRGRVWDNGDCTDCPCMATEHQKGYFTGRTATARIDYVYAHNPHFDLGDHVIMSIDLSNYVLR